MNTCWVVNSVAIPVVFLPQTNLALYGAGIAKQNYMAETASISNIIDDWTNKPELSAAISTLGMNNWRAELQAANTAFDNLYMARTRQLATISPDTINEKRQEASAAYYALRDRVDAYFTINDGTGLWRKTTDEMNVLIDQYNTLLAGRQGSGSEEEEGSSPAEG